MGVAALVHTTVGLCRVHQGKDASHHVPIQVMHHNPEEYLFFLLLHAKSLNQSLLLSESLSRYAASLPDGGTGKSLG